MWADNFLYRKSLGEVSKETMKAQQANTRFYMTANAMHPVSKRDFQETGAVNMNV